MSRARFGLLITPALALLAVSLTVRPTSADAQSQVRQRLQAPQPAVSGVAYLAVDLPSGRTLESVRPDMLGASLAPGSVIKIATLAAALESGVITDRTSIPCQRRVTVGGRVVTCTHPDFHRPLRPAEALAHSCNVFFTTIAARLSRDAFDAVLRQLGLGPSDRAQPMGVVALGLDGVRASPRQMVEMVWRVAQVPSRLAWRASTLATIRDGLRTAASVGTASALGERGIEALAKTGTTVTPAGVAQGLVAGVTPVASPRIGFALIASGAAGLDAAALAAARLVQAPAPGAAQAGSIRIGIARSGGGYDVRTMALDEYVAGVVAGENAQAAPAALEALAITVRTYALANRARHGADGFDLCDLTHCQVLRSATAASRRAASATRGRILADRGRPASVFYSASCGGRTERPSAVWAGAVDPPFLPVRVDHDCEGEPSWSSDIPARDLETALRAGGFKGDTLRRLDVSGRSSSGRAAWLRIDGFTPDRISANDLRMLVGRTLGWQLIRSTAFDVARQPSGYRFAGHGAGHGVGLCVLGSTRLAARGQSADAILAAYFPGLKVAAAPAAGEGERTRTPLQVFLPEQDEAERASLTRLARATLDRLTAALRIAPPAGLALRFHPTVESYQRATGQPWYTAGATDGSSLHFIPVSTLRRRGLLERTIGHELVHALTADALRGRPRWLVEGAATYYATPTPPEGVAAPAAASCPVEDDFIRPASSGTLEQAYARALTCFAREREAGGNWLAAAPSR